MKNLIFPALVLIIFTWDEVIKHNLREDIEGLKKEVNSCDYKALLEENKSLKEELRDWNDHVERMKKILGINHEGNISWVDKVSHPIDTKQLTR